MKLGEADKITINALKHYLGKPLRADSASDVLELIDKIERADFDSKISVNEKQILQNALDNYLKWFARMDSTPNVKQVIESINNYIPVPTNTSSSPPDSLGDKWTRNVIE